MVVGSGFKTGRVLVGSRKSCLQGKVEVEVIHTCILILCYTYSFVC